MPEKLITRKYMRDLIKRDREMHTSEKAFTEMDKVTRSILTTAIMLAAREGRRTVLDRDIIFATRDFANVMIGGSADA